MKKLLKTCIAHPGFGCLVIASGARLTFDLSINQTIGVFAMLAGTVLLVTIFLVDFGYD